MHAPFISFHKHVVHHITFCFNRVTVFNSQWPLGCEQFDITCQLISDLLFLGVIMMCDTFKSKTTPTCKSLDFTITNHWNTSYCNIIPRELFHKMHVWKLHENADLSCKAIHLFKAWKLSENQFHRRGGFLPEGFTCRFNNQEGKTETIINL